MSHRIRNAYCSYDLENHVMEFTPFVPRSEEFNLPSKTVPDQTIPFRELVDRHLNGKNVKTFTPAYTGPEPSMSDGIERMDKMERQMFSRQLSDFVADARGKLITRKQAAARAANERAIIEAHEARKASANTVEKTVLAGSGVDVVTEVSGRPGKSKE